MASITWASSEVVSVLMFLLPGFVWAGVYSSLISKPVSNGFQFVVQAFIFTVVFQLFAMPVLELSRLYEWSFLSSWIGELLVLVFLPVVIGIISARVWNKDYIHRLLRHWKVTVESSYRSAQYSAFAFHRNCYVILNLKGGRRLYGWPEEWPSRPDDRHFLIKECEWLVEENREPVEGVSHILVSESEVEMVEFLPVNSDTDPRKES